MEYSTDEKILMILIERTKSFDWNNYNILTSGAIADELSVSRNLVSQYLNDYHRKGKVIKINTRPVIFLDRDSFYKAMNTLDLSLTYDSIDELKKFCIQKRSQKSSFRKLIGYRDSLQQAVEQCKAAITYPGMGLPILIQGQTGTGKSFISQLTYNYAIEKGIINKDKRFINVNCAEYANNPELFLTNLFGFKKGAYTGAENDKMGLIALADGGVLFFDEVHALTAECQEKIFLFMDKGIYHMVGDNETWYESKVRLIFATTEDPQKTLLRTLLRRIPIMVSIPPLSERSLQEKRELIHELVSIEEKELKRNVVMSEAAYYIVLNYLYSDNVGELKNTIRASIANSYLRSPEVDLIEIRMFDLPKYILKAGTSSNELMNYEDSKFIRTEEMLKQEYFDSMIYSFNKEIIGLRNKCTNVDELKKYSIPLLENYIDYLFYNNPGVKTQSGDITASLVENIYYNVGQRYNFERLRNIEILTISKYLMDFVAHGESCISLNDNYYEEIQYLINIIKEQFPLNCDAIINVARLIQSSFNINMEGIGYLNLLLYMLYYNRDMEVRHIPAIIIAHGYNIASGIAETTNQLLNRKIFDSIDMPIECGIDIIIKKVLAYLKRLEGCKEIMLLVDMGSLEEIHRHTNKFKNINIGIINNVGTKLALDIGSMLIKGKELEEILKETVERNQPKYSIIRNRKKPDAILSICKTGFGTAEKIKKLIEDSLPTEANIQVICYEYDNIELMGNKSPLFDRYNIIFTIGTTNPKISDISFISLEELIEQKNVDRITDLLKRHMTEENIIEFNNNLVRNFPLENLINYLTILNPEIILRNVEDIIRQIEYELNIKLSSSTKIGLYIHISCLIERLIIGKSAVAYDKLDSFMERQGKFIKLIKKCFRDLENMYNVVIPVSEIGYLYEYIYNDRVEKIENSVEVLSDLFN